MSYQNLEDLIEDHKAAAVAAWETGDMTDELYEALYEFYTSPDRGPDCMPYGTAKARTGDPYNYVGEKLSRYFDERVAVCSRTA